ncbi:MAG: NYN domain-containing protein [Puniceicoccales bacterium]
MPEPFSQEHLLIDGYNLMHAWPETRRLLKSDIDGTREIFLNRVRIIHDMSGVRTTVVFDGRGAKPQVEYPTKEKTFAVVFSPTGLSADGVIEQLVAHAKDSTRCSVATRDNLVAESIRASGAVVLTPQDLMDWVDRCARQQADTLRKQRRKDRANSPDPSPWDVLG